MLIEWLQGGVGKITECWLIDWLLRGVGKITECLLLIARWCLKDKYVDWLIDYLIDWLQGGVGKITECWLIDWLITRRCWKDN